MAEREVNIGEERLEEARKAGGSENKVEGGVP